MKKLILMMAAAMLVLGSCQKEEIALETNEVNLFLKGSEEQIGDMQTYFFNNGDPYCCPPKNTCIDEVIIIGRKQNSVIDQAFDKISSKSKVSIRDFFTDKKDELSININDVAIEEVIKGNLILESAGPNSKGTRFMIFLDSKTRKRRLVIPFVK